MPSKKYSAEFSRTRAIVIKQRERSGSRSRPEPDDAQPLVPRGPAVVEAKLSGTGTPRDQELARLKRELAR